MHRLHVECIREIVDAGLEPIIIVGSVNGFGDRFYDPLHNPLTFAQQQEQIRLALPFVEDPEILPLKDLGNLERWCASVVALMKDRVSESVMHYRAKLGEITGGTIEPLSASETIFAQLGLASWRTVNKNPADDLLNGSDLRALPIDHPRLSQDLATPDYIQQLMQQARQENLDAALLKDAKIPITMLDLTLMRLAREAGVSTASLMKKMNKPGWQGLKDVLGV